MKWKMFSQVSNILHSEYQSRQSSGAYAKRNIEECRRVTHVSIITISSSLRYFRVYNISCPNTEHQHKWPPKQLLTSI